MEIPQTLQYIGGGLAAVLLVAGLIGLVLRLRPATQDLGQDICSRTGAWCLMAIAVLAACWIGVGALIILFALVSFQGLREYFAIVRVRRADQRALFYSMFLLLPAQYLFIYLGSYGMFAIFIPVYGFVAMAAMTLARADTVDFLARSAKIFYGLVIIVYFISHVPMLETMFVVDAEGWPHPHPAGELVLFLLLVSQGNDVCQYVWGKAIGGPKIAPRLSPNKTWAGFIGGVLSSAGIATGLAVLVPFRWWEALLLGALIACLGFVGDVIMSAIKRDAGIKDYGSLLGGHGGVLDRVDGLALAAPVYFHILRYYYGY